MAVILLLRMIDGTPLPARAIPAALLR